MLKGVDIITVIGLVAGAFTTISFIPQVVRTWRIKSARDLSLAMVSLNSTGIFLWLVYGLCVGSIPIIVANFVTFILISTLVVLTIRYR
jgi:MtN3 and saliva related transmembrane protein